MSEDEVPLVPGSILVKLLEHNNWANDQLIEACSALDDAQLDARNKPEEWSPRQALVHLVEWQQEYLAFFVKPPETSSPARDTFEELRSSASESGKGLLALARDESGERLNGEFRTSDGYLVEPWVVMVQVINHATDHRRQIAGMLRSVGVTPPNLDGWGYGEATGALTKLAE